MADTTLWWLAAGILVAAELVTGTFYLLMLALGLAAGAVAAHLGLGSALQVVAAALVGGGAVLAWHLLRRRPKDAAPANANPDVNLDVGETVHIAAWSPDGTASVKYRGAQWTALPAPGQPAADSGAYRIVEVRGSQLLVAKITA
ncbi:MAG: NfeD family protein [Hylemonella sp.]|uniref:NfeD family protein n=1 Tax=Hylemonella sp. TaxID=2066020 RepID=UPI0022C5A25B|nr:NfeD family protein [Hylemonella sp.]MCZ8251217.1 NfeD family protein [Hylemonella sp.]